MLNEHLNFKMIFRLNDEIIIMGYIVVSDIKSKLCGCLNNIVSFSHKIFRFNLIVYEFPEKCIIMR